jgi:hypothetical protein
MYAEFEGEDTAFSFLYKDLACSRVWLFRTEQKKPKAEH